LNPIDTFFFFVVVSLQEMEGKVRAVVARVLDEAERNSVVVGLLGATAR